MVQVHISLCMKCEVLGVVVQGWEHELLVFFAPYWFRVLFHFKSLHFFRLCILELIMVNDVLKITSTLYPPQQTKKLAKQKPLHQTSLPSTNEFILSGISVLCSLSPRGFTMQKDLQLIFPKVASAFAKLCRLFSCFPVV